MNHRSKEDVPFVNDKKREEYKNDKKKTALNI